MRRAAVLALAVTAALAGALVLPSTATASGSHSQFIAGAVPMNGAQEIPGPGDADARGIGAYAANRDVLCYVLSVRRIEPATLAHIHRGPVGVAGPIVIMLVAPTNGTSAGCIRAVPDEQQTPENAMMTLTRTELADIIANPVGFYFNVHNAPFPAGALRGQLR